MSSLVSQLGNFNPQFLRECRGRLRPRSAAAALGLSVLFQFLLWTSVTGSAGDEVTVDDWLDICQSLTWVIPYALFTLGGYYIVDDLTQEAKSGTLNFIRLSPRPAREILLGKLLGVPILPALLVAAMIPLHVVSGLLGGLSPLLLGSYYLIVIAGAITVFTLALLVGLGSGNSSALAKQRAVSAIAFSGLVVFGIAPLFMSWNTFCIWPSVPTGEVLSRDFNVVLEWMYLPITGNPLFGHIFTLGTLAIAAALIWRIAVRKFRIPEATLLSKRLSYVIVAYLNILAWGFLQTREMDSYDRLGGLAGIYAMDVALGFALIFALVPSRQMLLNWLSYRPSGQKSGGTQQANWLDWIWVDVSPSMGAIAINFIIVAALLVPSLLLFIIGSGESISIPGLIFSTVSLGLSALTYAAIVQLIFSMRLRAPMAWAVGTVAVLAIVPVLVLTFLNVWNGDSKVIDVLVTFLGVPALIWTESEIPPVAIVGLVGQICFLGFVWTRFNQNLKKLVRPVAQDTF
ncbi:MAG: hypothetical protein AAFO84_09030 [Cyanobacteria bacterium J06598_1]